VAGRKAALAVVPCYDTVESTHALLAKFPADREYDVLLVDDGSSDGTAELLRGSGFGVVLHGRNRGLGAAIKTGIRHALDHGYEVVAILAGNGKDDPAEIPKLLAALREGADYVQGSRFAA